MTRPLSICIGWDSTEKPAYAVAADSLEAQSSLPLRIHPLKQDALRRAGLYNREADPKASTEFTYTRFLTPALCGTDGYAVYFDCDFLWLGDIAEMMADIDPRHAVSVVKHDYKPTETVKMGGAAQSVYPRKNWSSLIVFNLSHPKVRQLTPDVVNIQSPKYLHRFEWLKDSEIGSLPFEWNWLEGWYDEAQTGSKPKAIHYTRGGPWIDGCDDVGYAEVWREAYQRTGLVK